jgi:hypothetical protein
LPQHPTEGKYTEGKYPVANCELQYLQKVKKERFGEIVSPESAILLFPKYASFLPSFLLF